LSANSEYRVQEYVGLAAIDFTRGLLFRNISETSTPKRRGGRRHFAALETRTPCEFRVEMPHAISAAISRLAAQRVANQAKKNLSFRLEQRAEREFQTKPSASYSIASPRLRAFMRALVQENPNV
jgi:hypothetical protein